MASTAKIAVSVPTATLGRLERARQALHRSRSAIVSEAIERWLEDQQPGADDQRYVEGYLRHPEGTGASKIAAAVVASWEPWSDEA
ncbi:MAG TPA: ribbon-helix-helix protein, CopG family [Kofleriaceae bacterium]|nr:ribbon-helix-helix protein, CopG family [Kofleriaceae bacterium]